VARVTVVLPSILATAAGGRNRIEIDATTVDGALRALPVADLIFDERGALRPLVNVFVGRANVRDRDGLATRVADGETVRLVQAVAGG
jgi:molybdopterin converting factor small subunit